MLFNFYHGILPFLSLQRLMIELFEAIFEIFPLSSQL